MVQKKTLKIDPGLFKLSNNKSKSKKDKPIVDREQSINLNKVKKEM